MIALSTTRRPIACVAILVHLLGGLFAHLCHDHGLPGGCRGSHGALSHSHASPCGVAGHDRCGPGEGHPPASSCPFTARRSAETAEARGVEPASAPRTTAIGSASDAGHCAACAFVALTTVAEGWHAATLSVPLAGVVSAAPAPLTASFSPAAFLPRGPPA